MRARVYPARRGAWARCAPEVIGQELERTAAVGAVHVEAEQIGAILARTDVQTRELAVPSRAAAREAGSGRNPPGRARTPTASAASTTGPVTAPRITTVSATGAIVAPGAGAKKNARTAGSGIWSAREAIREAGGRDAIVTSGAEVARGASDHRAHIVGRVVGMEREHERRDPRDVRRRHRSAGPAHIVVADDEHAPRLGVEPRAGRECREDRALRESDAGLRRGRPSPARRRSRENPVFVNDAGRSRSSLAPTTMLSRRGFGL